MNELNRTMLDGLSDSLKKAGVVDVKLTLNPEANLNPDTLATDVAKLLQLYLDGKCRVVDAIGDAPNEPCSFPSCQFGGCPAAGCYGPGTAQYTP